jgi:hypothetical protein
MQKPLEIGGFQQENDRKIESGGISLTKDVGLTW